MKMMKIKKYQPGEILFFEGEVSVILDGLVFMKSHTQDVVPPIMQGKYIQGDIIGFDQADGGVSSRVETWCIAHAPTEVAVFSKDDFEVNYHVVDSLYSMCGLSTSTARARCSSACSSLTPSSPALVSRPSTCSPSS